MARKEKLASMSLEQRERLREAARRYRQTSPAQRDAEKRYRNRNQENLPEMRALQRLRRIDLDPQGVLAAERERHARCRAKDPEKRRRLDREKEIRHQKAHPEKARERFRRKYLRAHPLTPAKQRQLFADVRAKVPITLPADIRDEVAGMVFEAIMSGRFKRSVTAHDVKLIITEHFRQFSKFSTVSLDEIIHEGASRGQLMGVL
jgi:hypothetical protein